MHEMVHIAHGEGMAVMSHTNGVYGVQAAVRGRCGVCGAWQLYGRGDFASMLAVSDTVWVPTLVTVRNLSGTVDDMKRLVSAAHRRVWRSENLKLAYQI